MNFQAWSAPVELIPSVIVPLNACLGTYAQASPSLTLLRLPCARIHVSIVTRRLPDLPDAAKHPPDGSTLIVNDRGELIDFVLTPGNVKPVPRLARRLFFGDKGYLSRALRDELYRMFNIQLITGIRANIMLPLLDKLLLRRRVIVR